MKNTKKIAFLCIAINIILLLQLCLGTVMALEEDAAYIEPEQTVEEAVIEAQGGEMQIMAANDCTIIKNCASQGHITSTNSGSLGCGCVVSLTRCQCGAVDNPTLMFPCDRHA